MVARSPGIVVPAGGVADSSTGGAGSLIAAVRKPRDNCWPNALPVQSDTVATPKRVNGKSVCWMVDAAGHAGEGRIVNCSRLGSVVNRNGMDRLACGPNSRNTLGESGLL